MFRVVVEITNAKSEKEAIARLADTLTSFRPNRLTPHTASTMYWYSHVKSFTRASSSLFQKSSDMKAINELAYQIQKLAREHTCEAEPKESALNEKESA